MIEIGPRIEMLIGIFTIPINHLISNPMVQIWLNEI